MYPRNKTRHSSNTATQLPEVARHEALSGPSRSSVSGQKIFKLISYNISACIGRDRLIFPERILGIIRREAPDIVLLQNAQQDVKEVNSKSQIDYFANKLDMFRHAGAIRKVGDRFLGNVTLSKYPVIGTEQPQQLSVPSPQKTPLHSKVQLTYQNMLHVYNVSNKALRKPSKALHQADLLNKKTGLSVIMAGHFKSSVIRQIFDRQTRRFKTVISGKRFRNMNSMQQSSAQSTEAVLLNEHIKVHRSYSLITPLTRFASRQLPIVVQFSLQPGYPTKGY